MNKFTNIVVEREHTEDVKQVLRKYDAVNHMEVSDYDDGYNMVHMYIAHDTEDEYRAICESIEDDLAIAW